MSKYLLLSSLVAIIVFGSCKHYCHTNPFPVLKFTNFDSSDLNTIIITSHNTSEGGPTLLPVERVNIYTSRANVYGPDTMTVLPKDSSGAFSIPLDFNTVATIFIPSTGRTYNLRGYAIQRESWESVNCTNAMNYYLNDTPNHQDMQPYSNGEGKIIIKK